METNMLSELFAQIISEPILNILRKDNLQSKSAKVDKINCVNAHIVSNRQYGCFKLKIDKFVEAIKV